MYDKPKPNSGDNAVKQIRTGDAAKAAAARIAAAKAKAQGKKP